MNTTILIVEDDVVIATDLKSKLEQLGHEVVGMATTGEKALAIYGEALPDLIFMDIKLDGAWDGIETVKQLRLKSKVPVIYLSDLTDATTIRRANETLFTEHLAKPFMLPHLKVAIQRVFFGREGTNNFAVVHDAIFLKSGKDHYEKVALAAIAFLQADRAYCKVHTNDKVYHLSKSMKVVSEHLHQPYFVQIHRSCIVNIHHVTGIKGNMLEVLGHDLTIAEAYREEVKARFSML